ncbi:MAG: hypothetical protein PGN23_13055 [Sphingomonas adhaesiva]|uniref:hypothetical protein n=1 Tax=Sphingomonas adhaesiva TaxID=28212 RepID=UPI002FF465BA
MTIRCGRRSGDRKAARAGPAGCGFAVVAGEVKKPASDTKAATTRPRAMMAA